MAKLKTGVGIASISGTSGSAVFATRRDGSVILRERPSPSGRTTAAQREARDTFARASAAWRGLTLEEQSAWLQWARATDPFAGASGAANAFRSLAVRWYGVNGPDGDGPSAPRPPRQGTPRRTTASGAPSSCAGAVTAGEPVPSKVEGCPEHEEGVGGGAAPGFIPGSQRTADGPEPETWKAPDVQPGQNRPFPVTDFLEGRLHPLTPSSCVRHEPSGPHEEGGLGVGPPRLPPLAPFGGDAVVVLTAGTSVGIRFTADRANALGVVTELLAVKVVSGLSAPRDRDFRVVGRVVFTEAGQSVDVPLKRGRYAVAVRFVLAATGQATEVLRGGFVEAG